MAKATIQLPEDFLLKLSRLGDKTDEVCEKVLEAGAKVVKEKVATNLNAAIGKNLKTKSRSTGQLQAALGVSKARPNRNGDYDIKIGFAEPRDKGISNAGVASILEYGKSSQPPRPFLKPAQSASKDAAIDAMKAAFEEEVQKL